MPFSKLDMQKELLNFLSQFGKNIASLFGDGSCDWTGEQAITKSPIWKAASEMYDYGVMGVPSGDLGPKARVNGIHAHTEMFLHAIDTPQMKLYLEESDNTFPRLAMLAMQSAVARTVLDDGDRYTDFGAYEHGIREGDYGYLTIFEVALLANMDERSVRNAANPKLADPLKTEQKGKRSLVSPEAARHWLAGRKGFIPTTVPEDYVVKRPPDINVTITEEDLVQLEQIMKETGLSLTNAWVERLRREDKEGKK